MNRRVTGEFVDPWDRIKEMMGSGREKRCVVTRLSYMEKSKKSYVREKKRERERIIPNTERITPKQGTGLFTYKGSDTMWNFFQTTFRRSAQI